MKIEKVWKLNITFFTINKEAWVQSKKKKKEEAKIKGKNYCSQNHDDFTSQHISKVQN
jgi:hypothetical protein